MENVARAIELKQQLDSLRPVNPEYEKRIMQKFRLDWNYHSNNLEGNSLSYGETKALILFGITAQGKPLKDHFEITGHNEAINWVLEVINEERPITENFIRALHKLILKEPYEVDAITPEGKLTKKRIQVGVYKSTANHVKTMTGEIFRFATPEETPAKMHDLVEWYRKKSKEESVNAILMASEFHYRFIRIHPFDDGNGRTARILMNFILMRYGYPPVIIKTLDKENYFAVLRQADAGIIEPFVEYIAGNLVQSLEIMIRGARGEDLDDDGDLDKEIALLDGKLKYAAKNQKSKWTNEKDKLLHLFDESISHLLMKFITRLKKFERFYDNSIVNLQVDDVHLKSISNNTLMEIRDLIDARTGTIYVKYVFSTLKEIARNHYYFSSTLVIKLNKDSYKIELNKATLIEKEYVELFPAEEIDKLVDIEVKRHTAFIEQKIDELNNRS